MLKFVVPAYKHRRAFWAFCRAFWQAGEKIQGVYVKPRTYREFLQKYAANKFFLMEEGGRKIIGLTAFTFGLDEDTRRLDGDFAYCVAPGERRRGYGRRQFAMALSHCRDNRMERLCVTCRKANAPSRKIIEASGGVLSEEFSHDGVERQVYWISL